MLLFLVNSIYAQQVDPVLEKPNLEIICNIYPNPFNFRINLKDDKGALLKEIKATTIGRNRILSFASVNAKSIEVIIDGSKETPLISELAAFHIDESLIEK